MKRLLYNDHTLWRGIAVAEEKRPRGRPKSDGKRRKITIELREEWVAELNRLADLRETRAGKLTNRTDLIREAVREFLDRQGRVSHNPDYSNG